MSTPCVSSFLEEVNLPAPPAVTVIEPVGLGSSERRAGGRNSWIWKGHGGFLEEAMLDRNLGGRVGV